MILLAAGKAVVAEGGDSAENLILITIGGHDTNVIWKAQLIGQTLFGSAGEKPLLIAKMNDIGQFFSPSCA